MLKKYKNVVKQKQFAVIGLGRFGIEMVKALVSEGCEVLAIDNNEDKTLEVTDIATHTIVADASEEGTLKSIAIGEFDVVIIAIGTNIQASIITALICKEMGVKYIVAKANNDKHAKVLEKIGVDKIVIPESDSAIKTAKMLNNPKLNDIMELEEGYCVAELIVPANWIGKSIIDLRVRNEYNVNILLIIFEGNTIMPTADRVFTADDKVIIGGLSEDIANFFENNN